jgi:hypothetical protein
LFFYLVFKASAEAYPMLFEEPSFPYEYIISLILLPFLVIIRMGRGVGSVISNILNTKSFKLSAELSFVSTFCFSHSEVEQSLTR